MDQQITVVIVNRKEHLLKVRLVLYVRKNGKHFNQISIDLIFAERWRLPFGPFDCGYHDHSLFSFGNAMGRGINRTFFESRQIFNLRVLKCCTWRKASIFGNTRTKSYAYCRFYSHWPFRVHGSDVDLCTNARPFWPFPLHGRILPKRPPDVGSTLPIFYARKVPT